MFDIVAGPMFICGLGEEDFTSIQGEMLEKYMEKFKHPEVFVKIGHDILAMKVPDKQQQQEKQNPSHKIVFQQSYFFQNRRLLRIQHLL